jgi:hypothetical protein
MIMLMSLISCSHKLVEYLKTVCKESRRSPLVYYYCSGGDNSSCLDVLASFLDQLVWQAETIPSGTRVMYAEEKKRPRKELTLDIIMTAFREALTSFDAVYILVDALDEFSGLKTLMKQLEAIQQWQVPQLRLLITSQPHKLAVIDTVNALPIPRVNRINIAEDSEDISAYINRFLHESVDLRKFLPDFPDLYEDIRATLQTKANNSFVFLHLFGLDFKTMT